MKYQSRKRAILVLADGTIFHGKAVGGREGTPSVKFVSIRV